MLSEVQMPQKPDPEQRMASVGGPGFELKDLFYVLMGAGVAALLVGNYIEDSQNPTDLPVLDPNQKVTATVEEKYCQNVTPVSQPRIVTEPNAQGQPTKYAVYCPR